MSEGAAYSERPVSLYALFSPVAWWLLALFLWGILQWAIHLGEEIPQWVTSIYSALVAIFLILGPIMPIPFILKRQILLTSNGVHIEFGFFKDTIPLFDIESIEPVKKPLIYSATWVSGPSGWWNWGWGLFIVGVTKIKGVKWYVLRMGRNYFRIDKRNGDAICVSISRPEEFMEKWKMLKSGSMVYSPEK